MATKKSQRIGIWIIAIAMAVGTLASFLVMVLAPGNDAQQQARMEQLSAEYQTEYEAYQERVNALDMALASELSKQYFAEFKQYQSRVSTFDADGVKELGMTDLKQGNGDALTSESSFSAYYIGWNPEGKTFDSSIEGEGLKLPITAAPGSVIKGWTDGVDGMKIGGVRELTIPSDLAYGESGQGADIPPNTPLKFVIMVVPAPDRSEAEAITPPEMSEELRDIYRRQYGMEF